MSCHSCGSSVAPGDRFCARCGVTLEQRCATCGTVLPGEARFCPSCGSAVAVDTDDSDGPSGEERKTVSVLFADLVGFTASSDGADPEDVRRRVQPFHTALRAVVEGYGGRIEKLMGDGVLAVFGAPVAHEDDAERAVRAGLTIQERVAQLEGMRARVAVGTGEAMVLVEGATSDREGLVGDVVNTASRLQGEAEPGTVLVDEATHRATRRAFHYEERSPVAVKGKGEPIEVWVALEPVARLGADLEDDGATLVGRSSELALLIDAFTRATRDRTSQIVTVAGEPGVGKSRLVRELRRYISDLPDLVRWRQGRCLPYGEGITYWALGEVVKAEAGVFETDTPASAIGKLGASLEPLITDPDERSWLLGRLSPLVGSDQEAAADRDERFAAWHRYLTAFGEQRPTVMVVEDLHWADANLVEFLDGVPEATRGTALLLVCTTRPDFFETHPGWGTGQRNAITIRLDPLDASATAQLLDELLEGEVLDDATRQLVLDRSGGNPLWAQEFVRMLSDRTAESPELAIPDTVQAVVASRIDLLDAETKAVIQAASIVGKSFWAGTVSAVLDDVPDVEESLRELGRRELIRRERVSTVAGESEYAFTHSVVRDVAYGQTPRSLRAERHHRVGRWIERMAGDRIGDRAEVVAHHDAEALALAAATSLPDVTRFVEAAIRSHRRAAERAAHLDLDVQRNHLESALELLPPGDARRGSVLADLGSSYGYSGRTDISIKTMLEAREEFDAIGDIEQWGRVMSELTTAYWASGDPGAAQDILEDGITRLEQHPPGPALALAYSQQAGRLWLRGDSSAEALELIGRVRPIVEVHGDIASRRRLKMAEGGIRFDQGDPAAVEVFRDVLRMAIETDESQPIGSGYLNLGEQLRTGWGTGEAIAVHERGLEVSLQRRLSGIEQFLRGTLAVDHVWAGHWDESLLHIEAALGIRERLAYLEGGFHIVRLLIEACRGEGTERGQEHVQRLVTDVEVLEDLQAIVPMYDSATWIHLASGDEAQALEYARKVVDRSGATRFLLDALSATTWLLRRAGELGRLEELLPGLRRFDMPRPRALLVAVDALLMESVDPARALDSLSEAADALSRLGAATDALVMYAEAFRVASDIGDGEQASELRDRARTMMEPAGATRLLEVLRLG